MEIIDLPEKPFSVKKLQEHFLNGVLKENLDALYYIFEYYYEIGGGNYYFYDVENDEFVFKTDTDFKKEVLKKVGSKNFTLLIERNPRIFKIQCKIGKPRIYSVDGFFYINESGGFKHQNYKNFDDYSDILKERAKRILDMIKEISCNNSEEMFDAYMTYWAQIARGMKTEVIPYRKSKVQGFGKSEETNFFMNYVFGKKVCYLCSDTSPLLTSYNKCLLGKILVVFEELPIFTDSQWSGISSRLKTWSTEKTCMYSDKYEKQVQAENISNYLINCNDEAVKDCQGRRYAILDLNTIRLADYAFFSSLKKDCYNDEVGEVIFSYLLTKISDEKATKFYGQRDFPETSNKRIAISNRLPNEYKFIKEEYLLKNKSIKKVKSNEFYEYFECFCIEKDIKKKLGRNNFYKSLEEIRILQVEINKVMYYNISIDELKKLGDKHKWICEYDRFENNEANNDIEEVKEDKSIEYLKTIEKLQKEKDELNERISYLEKDNMEFKKLYEDVIKKEIIIPITENEDIKDFDESKLTDIPQIYFDGFLDFIEESHKNKEEYQFKGKEFNEEIVEEIKPKNKKNKSPQINKSLTLTF